MIDYLLGAGHDIDSFFDKQPSHAPFADILVSFVATFSESILADSSLRRFPDLVALGFWMRSSHLEQLRKQFTLSSPAGRVRVARGNVLHFAPANVDTLFAYSLFISLLLGNRNLVRVSERENPVQGEIIRLLRTLLARNDFSKLSDDLAIVRYPHDNRITAQLSAECDCRVIWGGDNSVSTISTIPISPRATEIKFADKWSLALLDAQSILDLAPEQLQQLGRHFINDSYWYGQQACSSPRMVVWQGTELTASRAQSRFWTVTDELLQSFVHRLEDSDLVNKFAASCEIAALHSCRIRQGMNNLLTRIEFSDLDSRLFSKHCGSGLFYEHVTDNLVDLKKIITRQTQTLSYFGIDTDKLKSIIIQANRGIDRIVPVGQALDFDILWDGYDLFEELTRGIVLRRG